jgi:5-formyltetrahydrofolate cyclo-ligase
MGVAEEKAVARNRMRQARSARSRLDREAAARGLAETVPRVLATAGDGQDLTVTAYLSMPTEPELDLAMAQASELGHRVLTPRIVGTGLDWIPWHPDAHVLPGPLGIREQVGDALGEDELGTIDVLLIPGLAVDADGHRLGQGGGFYDRFLGGFPRHDHGGPLRVMVIFDDELVAELPYEGHDELMDVAVTPRRVVTLG